LHGTGQLTKISCDNGATPAPKHSRLARHFIEAGAAAQHGLPTRRKDTAATRDAERSIDPHRTIQRQPLGAQAGGRFGIPVMRGCIFGQDYAKALAAERNNFRFDRTSRGPALATCFGMLALLSLQQRGRCPVRIHHARQDAFAKQQQDFGASACLPADAPLGSPTNCEN
jgi:hypothetical protein